MAVLNNSPLLKKQLIESQVSNGKCYLRLLCVLPSFERCTAMSLEDVIIDLSIKLGSNPLGLDVLHQLWVSELKLSHDSDSVIELDITDNNDLSSSPVPVGFISKIMCAPYRFGLEDRGGILHITYYLKDNVDIQDSSTEVETEVGLASRYILQIICNQSNRVGATIDLDELFCEIKEDINFSDSGFDHQIEEGPRTILPFINDNSFQNGTGLYDPDPIKRETQSRVEDVYYQLEKDGKLSEANDKAKDTGETVSKLMERIIRMEEKMNSVLSINKDNTITPDDSSSNIGRYDKKFMNGGTVINSSNSKRYQKNTMGPAHVYNHTKGGTLIGIREDDLPLDISKNVAIGFVKTKDIRAREVEQLGKIAPINGLANPFKDSRLNMLMHFHTAVHNVMPRINNDSYIKMMNYLITYKPKCASEEFAYQLVIRTFDLNDLVVIANPFKLPFIEVGMQITDSTLVKCFDLLKNEYKSLWFDQLKHLHVPSFHDEYSEYSSNHYSKKKPDNQYNQYKSEPKQSKHSGVFVRNRNPKSEITVLR